MRILCSIFWSYPPPYSYCSVSMYMACVHAFLCHVSERTSEEANSEVDFPSFLRIKFRHVQQKRLYPLSHLPAYCLPGHCWSFQSCFFVSFCFWQELVMYLVAQINIELVILFTFHILGPTFFGVFAWSLTNSKLLLKSPFKYFREYLLM